MKKRSWVEWITWGISILVILFLAYIVFSNWDLVRAFPWRFNLIYFFGMILLQSMALLTTYISWHLMVARIGGFNNARINYRLYFISSLAKRLPTSLPYIGSRLVMYRQFGVSRAAMANCILLESLLFGVAGVLFILLCLPFLVSTPNQVVFLLLVAGILFLALIIIRPQFLVEWTNWILRHLNKQPLMNMPGRKDILLWVVIYFFPWPLSGTAFYFAFRALSNLQTMAFIDAWGISSISTLVSLLNMILPGGIALREMTSSALMTTWMPFSTAVILSFVIRLVYTCLEIFWAITALLVSLPSQINEP